MNIVQVGSSFDYDSPLGALMLFCYGRSAFVTVSGGLGAVSGPLFRLALSYRTLHLHGFEGKWLRTVLEQEALLRRG
jgi:hypothetical protein